MSLFDEFKNSADKTIEWLSNKDNFRFVIEKAFSDGYDANKLVVLEETDQDDLGYVNDIVMNMDGTITKVNINREVVTIRGIVPGEHIINVHYNIIYIT